MALSPFNAGIIDIDGGGRVSFQLIPPHLAESKQVNWGQYPILGRSSPLMGYQSSGPRLIDITLEFFAMATIESPIPAAKIKQDIDFLRSLTYADYAGSTKPPHRCYVWYGANIEMIGVVQSFSSEPLVTSPWDLGPGYAHHVRASLQFAEVKDSPLDTYDVRGGAT